MGQSSSNAKKESREKKVNPVVRNPPAYLNPYSSYQNTTRPSPLSVSGVSGRPRPSLEMPMIIPETVKPSQIRSVAKPTTSKDYSNQGQFVTPSARLESRVEHKSSTENKPISNPKIYPSLSTPPIQQAVTKRTQIRSAAKTAISVSSTPLGHSSGEVVIPAASSERRVEQKLSTEKKHVSSKPIHPSIPPIKQETTKYSQVYSAASPAISQYNTPLERSSVEPVKPSADRKSTTGYHRRSASIKPTNPSSSTPPIPQETAKPYQVHSVAIPGTSQYYAPQVNHTGHYWNPMSIQQINTPPQPMTSAEMYRNAGPQDFHQFPHNYVNAPANIWHPEPPRVNLPNNPLAVPQNQRGRGRIIQHQQRKAKKAGMQENTTNVKESTQFLVPNVNPGNRNENVRRQRGRGQAGNVGRGGGGGDGGRGCNFFGFKMLEELLDKDPEQASMKLVAHRDALVNYLTLNHSPDIMVLVIEVICVILKGNFPQVIGQLLLTLTNIEFFHHLEMHIMQIPLEDAAKKYRSRRFWQDFDQFFTNVALTMNAMLETVPATAMDVVPHLVKAVQYTLPNIETEHRITFAEHIRGVYEELLNKVKLMQTREENIQKRRDRNNKRRNRNQEGEEDDEEDGEADLVPPEDFHEIDIYPTSEEITKPVNTFLRKNVVRGGYRDVHHYLDVHFRLLREDFVAPLRFGICEYITDENKKMISNIKVHKHCMYLGVVPNQKQVGYLMQVFKPNSIRNLEHSRRFMFGSLVCLTSDKFKNVIFGKIIDRDAKFLTKGQLVLGFDVGIELDIITSYLLVECSIYFEPYFQVLNALKHIDEQRFPMKEYLVDVRRDAIAPEYLNNVTLEDYNETLRYLNCSQGDALVGALRTQFCFIQGPPGTGKTYLGLKIAKFLLSKKANFEGPMLVICYTNHALDQFLEGLLEATTNLVRVGGQSRNEQMAKYNLKNLRVKKIPGECFGAQRASLARLHQSRTVMSVRGALLTLLNDYTHIVSFDKFSQIQGTSWFASASRHDILQWLLYQPHQDSTEYQDMLIATQIIRTIEQQEQPGKADEQELDDDTLDGPDINPRQFDENEDPEININYTPSDNQYLFSCPETHELICKLTSARNELHATEGESMEFWQLTQRLLKIVTDYKYVCEQLNEIRNLEDNELPHFYLDYDDPHAMAPRDRWLAYALWTRKLRETVMEEYVQADREYRKTYTEMEEVREMIDLFKLRQTDVVGITTTGAARLHKTLQALGCCVVIVEEAAEVLEAHIVTALSPKCKHLILIGDHKQLKPSTADYEITTDYRLGVSLFERMVDNGLHCHTLNVQHRMRPEIANLVCPSIYPNLINHESVEEYPHIRGVTSSLYFITHSHRETESSDKSKENDYEAQFLILLAKYLVLNNYDPESITILAAYSGQWFLMKRLKMKYHALNRVRLCVLDNYQGEENDIILLSLVRNNTANVNGFLALENRICVALSRAKMAMYIMGNIQQLCHKNEIWRQVHEVLQKYNAVGPSLTLQCVNHRDNLTNIVDIKDFEKVPEGGCLRPCNATLDCGHTCVKMCHSTTHDSYKCHQPCNNIICELGHQCPLQCFEECQKCEVPRKCTLKCGHIQDIPCYMSPDEFKCTVSVSTTLPCSHIADKPCHADAETFKCPHPCDTRVEPCGHSCLLTCHIRRDPHHEKYKCRKPCAQPNAQCMMEEGHKHMCKKLCSVECDLCPVRVKKERSCNHFYDIRCHEDVEAIDCTKKCKRKMECGHNCNNICNQTCGPCESMVMKDIPECGHKVEWKCAYTPTKKNCKSKKCSSTLICGHPCPLPCSADCWTAKCTTLVRYTLKPSPCGHALVVPCHLRNQTIFDNELLSSCTAKCEQILKCGHPCKGTCGSCAQGRMHACCGEGCSKILICGHACTTPCVVACRPCSKPCDFKCEHSKCMKNCGVPCTKCNEPCNRMCVHQACTSFCGAKCNVPPCMHPCTLKLDCGHDCIGYCGDDCPPFCRVCDADEVTTIFFGNEDDPDARFVYLPQCKHLVEGDALEHWFGTNSDAKEITLPTCPKCKSPVQLSRYKHLILEVYSDIQKVKARFFGDPKELRELIKNLGDRVKMMKSTYIQFHLGGIAFFEAAMKTNHKHKRQDHSKMRIAALEAQFDLFEELVKCRYETALKQKTVFIGQVFNWSDDYFRFLEKRLLADSFVANQQQIDEFQAELLRFQRISQLSYIQQAFPDCVRMSEYRHIINLLNTFEKYTVDNPVMALLKRMDPVLLHTVERKQIVAAIGLSPGHWFKCRNGHIYAIGECGGAMQIGKCPECGLQIGGTSHALLGDNRLATEMDGATAPAFPTINNLALYEFN